MAKEVTKKVLTPEEEQMALIEAQKRVDASKASKAPITSNDIQDSTKVVYQTTPFVEGASMEKPQAQFPNELLGMNLKGGAMKAVLGYNPYEDFSKVAMDRYNIEQGRLNNTAQRLPTPETTTTYTAKDINQVTQSQTNKYTEQQIALETAKGKREQQLLDAQLGNVNKDTIDADFDEKKIGQIRPYLTGTEINPMTGKPGWNIDNVRNTLQGGLLAIKKLHPEVEIPDISDLSLSDGARIDKVRKFIVGYADGAFDLPFSSQGIGFMPLKPKSQLTPRARAIYGSMNNYSTVTGGGRSPQVKSVQNSSPDDDSTALTVQQLRHNADSLNTAWKSKQANINAQTKSNPKIVKKVDEGLSIKQIPFTGGNINRAIDNTVNDVVKGATRKVMSWLYK